MRRASGRGWGQDGGLARYVAVPVREAVPGLGHAIELRVYRHGGTLHIDWWYDTRRLGRPDVESLSRHFAAALLELAGEATLETDIDSADDELALVDLSSLDS